MGSSPEHPKAAGGRGPLIRFQRVTRRFGAVTAVDGVSLDIAEGEIFCLLGPSGCGKTTLMRMLAGFEHPDEGAVLLDGQDLSGTPPHRRPVNMMFQSYALFPHLNVAGNIAFGLKQAALARDEIAARVAGLVDLAQLRGLEERKPSQLSGGQKQRVALARALARRPRVLLLDEPLGALDRKIREETQFQLMHIQKELGTTFVIVTHDQDEAMVMADRIGVMEAGRLAQVGAPEDIYERPATRSVAAFIGDINLIDGVAAGRAADGLLRVQVQGFEEPFICAADEGIADRTPVSLAVRPESVRIGEAEPGHNALAGEIEDIAFRGDWSMLMCRTVRRLPVKAAVTGAARRAGHRAGDAVTLSFDPRDARALPR